MDQYSNFYRQTRQVSRNPYETRNAEVSAAFSKNCKEYASLLKINPDYLNADTVRSSQTDTNKVSKQILNLFPNYEQVVDKHSELYATPGYYGMGHINLYYEHEVVPQRLKKFFNEEWTDYANQQHLEALVSYINISHDFQAQKLLTKLDLSPEFVEKIFTSKNFLENLTSKFNPFLVASFSQYYQTEEIETILKTSMVSDPVPNYIGISEEQINLRKRLDVISQERLGVSLNDLKYNNFDRFHYLFYYERNAAYADTPIKVSDSVKSDLREELWHDYQDRFLQTCLKDNDFSRLKAYDPDLSEEQSPRKQKIFEFLDQNLPPEKLPQLFSNNDYMRHCLKKGSLSDEALQELARDKEYTANLITSPELSDHQAMILFQSVAFSRSVDCERAKEVENFEIIRNEYQRRFAKDFDALTNEQGQTRAQVLLAADEKEILEGYNPSKEMLYFHLNDLVKLPVEQIRPYADLLAFHMEPDGKIADYGIRNLPIFEKIYQTYGPDSFSLRKDGSFDYNLTHYMMSLYKEKRLSPAESEILINSIRLSKNYRKYEPLFNANGETIYTVGELGNLINEEKAETLNILLADGLKFADDRQKYECFNNLIQNISYHKEKDDVIHNYLQQIMTIPGFDIAQAFELPNYHIRNTLDYILKQEHPDLKMLEKVVWQAAKKGAYHSYDYDKIAAAGLDLAVLSPEELISYESRREISLYPDNHLRAYDFNKTWTCNAARHPSDGSVTTFLNEMCHYYNAEGAAMALNNGADPFIAAEFMRGKYKKPPFQDLFIKTYFKKNVTPEMRKNNIAGLQIYMLGIAARLDEGKTDTLKRIWKSLDLGEGRPLSIHPEIRALIQEVNQAYAKRDFKAEQLAREEAEREKQRRIEAEKQERLERERQENEQRAKQEQARLRKEQITQLSTQLTEALGDLTSLDPAALTTQMADYLRENADQLPVNPNPEELENIKSDLFKCQVKQQEEKENRRQQTLLRVEAELREKITQQEQEAGNIMSPAQIGKFAQEFYKEDPEAKSVLLESLKVLNEEAKTRQIKATKDQAMKLINQETHFQVAKQLLLKGMETPNYMQYPRSAREEFLHQVRQETLKSVQNTAVVKTFDDYTISLNSCNAAASLSQKFINGEAIESKYFTRDGKIIKTPELMKEVNEELQESENRHAQKEKELQKLREQEERQRKAEAEIRISDDPSRLEEAPEQPVKGSSREEIKAAKKAAKASNNQKPDVTLKGLDALAVLKDRFNGGK